MDPTTVTPIRADGLTLADIAVSWTVGDRTRTVTGRQVARLLAAAAERSIVDENIGGGLEPGQWPFRLRGLGALIYQDAGDSLYEADGRAFIADMLEHAAAEIVANELDGAEAPKRFRVEICRTARPPAGMRRRSA